MYRWCFLLGLLGVAWAQSGDGMTRFETPEAVAARASHHYCLQYGQTEFPNATDEVWTIFLQFPMLSFLDAARKDNLFRTIASLMNAGGASPMLNESDFCVGTYESYRLTYYEESVLIHLYFNSAENTANLNEYFRTGYTNALGSAQVPRAFDRFAIAIDFEEVRGGPTTDVHPSMNIEDQNADPTLRAIVLGYWAGNQTLSFALANQIQSFAVNPNPINYGLEAGDYIFSILGAVVVSIILGLAILGFFIHPFFLS